MDFTVHTTTGRDSYTGEDAGYTIVNSVLTVDDGKGKRLIYSPSGWLSVLTQSFIEDDDDMP